MTERVAPLRPLARRSPGLLAHPDRTTLVVAAWCAGLTMLVVGPLAGRGWVLLLDWVTGPRLDLWGRAWSGEALPSGPLLFLAAAALHRVSGAAVGWLVPALCLWTAGVGSARLIGETCPGATVHARLAGATAYLWNPFVHERLYAGQVNMLAGYALLPYLAAAVLRVSAPAGAAPGRSPRARRFAPARAGVWLAAAAACSVHFLIIGATVPLAVLAARGLRDARAACRSFFVTVGVALALTLPWLVVLVRRAPGAGDMGTVAVFATRADPRLGLLVGTLGQRGFWRPSPGEPGAGAGLWWALALACVVAVGLHGGRAMRRLGHGRTVRAAGLWALCGWAGSWGTRGPLGWAYTWALGHVPGFGVMREPGKFLCLVSLATAMGVGWGVASFGRGTLAAVPGWTRNPTMRRILLAALVVVPVSLTPGLAWGVGGRLAAVRYPPEWAKARAVLEASPAGRVAVLPWVGYVDLGFTGGRVVRNPGRVAFSDGLTSDDARIDGLHGSAGLAELGAALSRPDGADALATAGVGWLVAVKPMPAGYPADPRLVPVAAFGDVTVYRNWAFPD